MIPLVGSLRALQRTSLGCEALRCRPIKSCLADEARDCIIQSRHHEPALTGQGGVANRRSPLWRLCGPPKPGLRCQARHERLPRGFALIDEMPEALFTIDEEIEGGMDQIG